jgi:hypothetical protein
MGLYVLLQSALTVNNFVHRILPMALVLTFELYM